MEQRQVTAVLFLLVALSVPAQEEEREFLEVGTLSPDINRLEELSPKTGRTLVFLSKYKKKVIVTGSDFREETVLERFCGIAASEIRGGYWDYHTGKSYLDALGLYVIEKRNNGFRAVDVRQRLRLTFRAGPGDNSGWIQLGNGDAVRKNDRLGGIAVYNPQTDEVFFQQDGRGYDNVLWPGGNWIIPTESSNVGWGGGNNTHMMINYKTGEERSFYPDIISGVYY
jgi:hypothetical protein